MNRNSSKTSVKSKKVDMLEKLMLGTSLIALAAFSIAAPSTQLTKAQAVQVNALANQMEQACLHNPVLQNQKNEAVRMMTQWASSPEVCSCQSRMIREVTTPAVLAMNDQDKSDFYGKMMLTKGAECTVPAFKAKFATSCEQLFSSMFNGQPPSPAMQTRLDSLGFTDTNAFIKHACDCAKPALQKITTQEWVDGSLAQYNAYLERKRTGNKAIVAPPGPFDNVMNSCSPQPIQEKQNETNGPTVTPPSQ